ncbi:MAG: helix-turn-helix domain-containing protein [Clostridiaceae bacterium]|nr:helix-turn-helix domain-containing protein [Clostridiaceae bacterium]
MDLTFGEKIKEARKLKGLTQKQLAIKIGAKHNSISDWENNKNKPDPDTIELLCGVLDITPNYLLATESGEFSPAEKLFIKKYRNLDPFGQETVNITLDRETQRIAALQNALSNMKRQLNSSSISYQNKADKLYLYTYLRKIACAGTGFYFDDIPTTTIEAPYMQGADFIIGVNGDSMEPTYHDGDKLYVQKIRELSIGDEGIFMVWGECFVKELGERGLISRNPVYDDIPGTEDVRLIGRVLGKVENI